MRFTPSEVLTSFLESFINMTEMELTYEWFYRRDEFLGILLDSSAPATPEQIKLAEKWADEGIEKLKGRARNGAACD
jgi:hypothetical protein